MSKQPHSTLNKQDPILDVCFELLNGVCMVLSLVLLPLIVTVIAGWALFALSQMKVFHEVFHLLFGMYPLIGAFFGGVMMRWQIDTEWRERRLWYFVLCILSLLLFSLFVWWDIAGDQALFSLMLPYKLPSSSLWIVYVIPCTGLVGVVWGRLFAFSNQYPHTN